MIQNETNEIKHKNPFFEPYNTPHETFPFNKLTINDYEEAIVEGIRRENEEINNIINNPELPTFDNTLLREDDDDHKHYYDLLDRVEAVMSNMLSAETTDELDALAQKMMPILTKHANDISLNPKLFERIKAVYNNHRKLTSEEEKLLNDSYDGFVRSGALLADDDKATLRKLSEEESRLSLQFSQNLLKETKSFYLHIEDEEQLTGLPQTLKDSAKIIAKEMGKSGWVITLDAPIYGPFMMYSTHRDLREKLYMARNTLCIKDNSENNISICKRLINIRREIAQLLGYDTYADYVMKYRMASKVANVYKLLNDLIIAYKPTALEEKEEIERLAKSIEGKDFELKPWDLSYYAHKLKLSKYDLDPEELRPYFEVNNVIKGVFGLATRLYGITFKLNTDIPVYHEDVKAYEVYDNDGKYLAVLYVDFFPRKGKRDGAWMTEYQGQHINSKGENIRPHVSVVMNFSKSTDDKPALLRLGEVETFLHEFGHSLHGIFANSRFESQSGTNVWWDFVELPSQFMENFAMEKDFLLTFATHYKTGQPIPDELIEKIIASQNFNVATDCLRQISFGLLDMAYYTQKAEFKDDLLEFEKKAWKSAIIDKQLSNTCMTTQFSHIMAGGYAAGYYSYKWAEVLDADAFSLFKEKGIFNRDTAESFRRNILSKGGTEHPMMLYKRFRGHEPTIDALLQRTGIKNNNTNKENASR